MHNVTRGNTYYNDRFLMASTTKPKADSICNENIEYSSFNAHGLPRSRCVHGCMWCQTELQSDSRVITHSIGLEEGAVTEEHAKLGYSPNSIMRCKLHVLERFIFQGMCYVIPALVFS